MIDLVQAHQPSEHPPQLPVSADHGVAEHQPDVHRDHAEQHELRGDMHGKPVAFAGDQQQTGARDDEQQRQQRLLQNRLQPPFTGPQVVRPWRQGGGDPPHHPHQPERHDRKAEQAHGFPAVIGRRSRKLPEKTSENAADT